MHLSNIKAENKVDNTCKICDKPVNNKNGIQCEGECKSWAHFTCLKYNSQEINKIFRGDIKIICPCPDCTDEEIQADLKKPEIKPKNHKAKVEKDALPKLTCEEKCNENIPIKRIKEKKINREHQIVKGTKKIADAANSCACCIVMPHEEIQADLKKPEMKSKDHKAKDTKVDVVPKLSCEEKCIEKIPIKTIKDKGIKDKDKNKKIADVANSCACCIDVPQAQSGSNESSLSDLGFFTHSPKQKYNQSMINAMEKVCHTVGLLSVQIRDLMCKIMSKENK